MTTGRAFLAQLRDDIRTHPAVNHLFLNRLATAPFSRHDYRVFADNHIPLVGVFTTYLEVLLLRAPDSQARLWLAKVLVDEYGEGSDGHDHATMYRRFQRSCGGALGDGSVPEPARRFIETHIAMVREEPFLVGLGAVGPGHEWAIPQMFDAVIPGLRRAGFDEEAIAYFTLHVEQDDDHGAWLEESLADYADTREACDQIRRGAMASLEARARFWDGVQRAVVRYRQPRTIRQDRPDPRSALRELMVTMVDGSAAARRVEDRLRGWRKTSGVTLDELLTRARRVNP